MKLQLLKIKVESAVNFFIAADESEWVNPQAHLPCSRYSRLVSKSLIASWRVLAVT